MMPGGALWHGSEECGSQLQRRRSWRPPRKLAYAIAGLYLSKRAHIEVDGSAMATSKAKHADGGLMLKYDFDEHGDAGIGYRYFDREIDTADLRNNVSYDIIVLSLAYAR